MCTTTLKQNVVGNPYQKITFKCRDYSFWKYTQVSGSARIAICNKR